MKNGFEPISIEDFIKLHMKNNKNENDDDLRKRLKRALDDYKKGIKCDCGNDIWVIGSAFAGNSCFTCITGESFPENDYEIKEALLKNVNPHNSQEILSGYYNDNGEEINPNLMLKPSLCLTCEKLDDPDEEILCNLTRIDQKGNDEFKCHSYMKKTTI